MAQGRFFKEQIATLSKVGVGTIEPSESIETTGNIKLADNGTIKLGDTNDLQILHTGSDSIIKDAGTGNLELHATNLVFRNHLDTEQYASFINGGAVSLYYNNILKLSTSASGSTIHGDLTVGDGHFIGDDSFDNLTLISSSGENVVVAAANDIYLKTDASGGGTGTNRVLIDETGATVYGELTASSIVDSGLLSITGGGSTSPVGVNGLHLMFDSSGGTAHINAQQNGTSNRHLSFKAASYSFNSGNATFAGTLTVQGASVNIGNTLFLDNNEIWAKNSNNLNVKADGVIRIQPQSYGTAATFAANGNATFAETVTGKSFHQDAQVASSFYQATFDSDVTVASSLILHQAGNFNYISSQDASKDLIIRNTGSGKDMVLQVTSSSGTAELLRLRGITAKEIVATGNFEIRNGTNSRHINLYETYTDSSNYERSFFKHASSFLEIGTEAAGTGTASGIKFRTTGVSALSIDAGGLVTVLSRNSASSTNILSVGGSSNGYMSVRHIEGKASNSNAYGPLYINYLSNNNVFIASGGGNVGIGTTTPARTLSVVSGSGIVSTFTSSTSEAKIFYKASGTSGDYHVGTGASGDNLILLAGTSERMRIDSSGRVGLNETGMSSYDGDADDLVVKTGGNTGITLRTSSTGTGSIFFADGISGAERYQGTIRYFHNGNVMTFGTSATERMRINSNGNIGINYTSAAPHALSVKGTISRLNSSGIQVINLGTLSDHGQLTLNQSGGVTRVLLNTSGADSYINAGNFGIGTTSPASILDVNGGSANGVKIQAANAATEYVLSATTSNGTSRLWVGGTGNVGIGTTTPSSKLHVLSGAVSGYSEDTYADIIVEDSDARIQVVSDNGGTNGSSIILTNVDSGTHSNWAIGQTTTGNSNKLHIGHNTSSGGDTSSFSNTQDLVITTDGKVGIGTTSPALDLHVVGQVRVDNNNGVAARQIRSSYFSSGQDLTLTSGSAAAVKLKTGSTVQLTAKNNGRVGIGAGATSPDYTLDVAGDIGIGDYAMMKSTAQYMGMIGFNRNGNSGAIYNNSYGAFQLQNNNGVFEFQCYNSSGAAQAIHKFTSDGRVGINTTPHTNQQLHIVASSSDTTGLEFSSSIHSNESRILSYDRGSGGGYRPLRLQSSHLKVEIAGVQKFAVDTSGNTLVVGDLTVQGDISTTGSFTIVDTDVSTTEQLSITNDGTGPALIVNQTGVQPIVDFKDDGTSVFNILNGGDIVMTGDLRLPDGTGGSPSLTFSNGLDTGFYRSDYTSSPQKDQVNLSIDGNTKFKANEAGIWSVSGNIYFANGYQVRTFQEWLATTGGSGYGFKFRNTADSVDCLVISATGNLNPAGNITMADNGKVIATRKLIARDNAGLLLAEDSAATGIFINDSGNTTIQGTLTMASNGTGNSASSQEIIFYGTNSGGSQVDQATIYSARYLYNTNAGDLVFKTGNTSGTQSERMRINGVGNVGIGTDNPSSKFHLYTSAISQQGTPVTAITKTIATSTIGAKLSFTNAHNANGNLIGGISMGNTGEEYAGLYAVDGGSSAATHLAFFTGTSSGTTEAIRIRSDANVGIGETDPSIRLYVKDSESIVGYFKSTTNKAAIAVADDDTLGYFSAESGRVTMGFNSGLHVDNINIHGSGGVYKVGIGTTSPLSRLDIAQHDGASHTDFGYDGLTLSAHASASEPSIITFRSANEDGNLANSAKIGSVTTGTGSTYNGNLVFSTRAGASIAERMRVQHDGNVGIGVTAPSQKLEVGTNTDVSAQIGRSQVGHMGFGDHAGFSHLDRSSTTGYALLQSSSGDVFLNSESSRSIYFRKGNATIGGFNSSSDFYVDTDTLYVDASTDRVGIGVTDPDQKLDVNGNIRIPNQGKIVFGSAGTTPSDYLQLYDVGTSGDLLKLVQDGNTRFTITGVSGDVYMQGDVGIGTASPAAKLHVGPSALVSGYTPSTTTLAVSDVTNGAELLLRGQSPRIWFDVTSGGMGEMYLDGAQLNILSGTPTSAGSSRLYIKASGDVGIGTTTPAAKLDTYFADNAEPFRVSYASAPSSYYLTLDTAIPTGGVVNYRWHLKNNGTEYSNNLVLDRGKVGIGAAVPDSALELEVATGANTQTRCFHIDHNPTGNTGSGYMTIRSGTNTGASASLEQVSSGGGSLYGTYSDTNLINHGTQTSGAYNNINFVTNNAIRMTIGGGSQAGNVGIGTASPSSMSSSNARRLVVGSGSGAEGITIYSGNTNGGYLYFADGTSGDASYRGAIQYSHSTDALSLHTAGTATRMIITNGGLVGIGVTNPQVQFFNNLVVGDNLSGDKGITIRSNNAARGVLAFSDTDAADSGRYAGFISYNHSDNSMRFHTLAGNEHLTILSGGNVGIGNNNPTQAKLQVSGGSVLIDAYNATGTHGLFFRSGFVSSNPYNLSITCHNDGDGSPDALDINAFDGIYFNTGAGTRNNRAFINSSGKFCINQTDTSSDYLQVTGANGLYAARFNGSSTGGNSYGLRVRAGTNENDISFLAENTSGVDLFRVSGNGNVAIGNVTPTSKLYIHSGAFSSGEGEIRNDARVNRSYKLALGTTTKYIGTVQMNGNGDSSGFHVRIYDGHSKVWREVNVVVQNSGGTNYPKVIVEGGGDDVNINVEFAYVNRSGAAQKTDFYLVPTSNKAYTQLIFVDGFIERDTGHSSTSSTNINLDTAVGIYKAATDDSSRIGIGTNNPDQKLHVKGDALRIEESVNSRHLDIVPAVSGSNHRFTSTTTGSGYNFEYWNGSAATVMASLSSSGSTFYHNLTLASSNLHLSSAHYVQFGNANTRIQGSNSSNYLKFYTGGTERFEIANATATFTTDVEIGGNLTISGNVVAPNAPTNLSLSVVGETINVTFTASTTSNIDSYLVYSSVDGGDYGLISIIPPDDFGSTMSIIDSAFTVTGTQAYRVYAVKAGKLSSALSGNISYTVSSAEPTNLSVVPMNNAFYIQYDQPSSNSRFVSAYKIFKHEHANQGSLDRTQATEIYSGMNKSYMYPISGANNTNFHQFWVETTIAT